jgi:hypothetical protein
MFWAHANTFRCHLWYRSCCTMPLFHKSCFRTWLSHVRYSLSVEPTKSIVHNTSGKSLSANCWCWTKTIHIPFVYSWNQLHKTCSTHVGQHLMHFLLRIVRNKGLLQHYIIKPENEIVHKELWDICQSVFKRMGQNLKTTNCLGIALTNQRYIHED